MSDVKKVMRVRAYKAGYIVEHALISGVGGAPDFAMQVALTPSGDYIGTSLQAYRLCYKYGIKPEKADPSDQVCSIGWSEKNQMWYGWSHRAIHGFKVGDAVSEGDCTASSGVTEEYLKEHPEADKSLPVGFTAHTLEDAKRMAIAFADSVG